MLFSLLFSFFFLCPLSFSKLQAGWWHLRFFVPLPSTLEMEHLASVQGICTGTFLKLTFLGLGQGCNSVVGCLLNMCETLGLNLNTAIQFPEHHAPSRQLYWDPRRDLQGLSEGRLRHISSALGLNQPAMNGLL